MIDRLRALQAKLQQDKLAEFKRRVSLGDLSPTAGRMRANTASAKARRATTTS